MAARRSRAARSQMPQPSGGAVKLPPLDANKMRARVEKVESEQATHRPEWLEAYRLMFPQRYEFESTPGEKKTRGVYTSFPEETARVGVGNLVGALAPPGRPFWRTEPGERFSEAFPNIPEDQASDLLERFDGVLFEALQRSDMDSTLHEMAVDGIISQGHAVIEKGTRDEPLRFRAVPLHTAIVDDGPNGALEHLFQKYTDTLPNMLALWPLKLNEKLRQSMRNDPQAKHTVLVGDTTVRDDKGQRLGTKFFVMEDAGRDVLHEVDMPPEEPFRGITLRLQKNQSERFARGPALSALPTCQSLNQLELYLLKGAAQAVDPAKLLDTRKILNVANLRVDPGAYNMAASELGESLADAVVPLHSGQRADIAEFHVARMEHSIRRLLFAEEVVPPLDAGVRTATEIQIRRQAILAQRGVELGRLQREWLNGIVRRSAWILSEFGLFPREVAQLMDGEVFAIRPIGPLEQARNAEDGQSLLAAAQAIVASLGPEMAHLQIKSEELGAEAARKMGIPESLIRNEDERDEMQRNVAQIAAAGATEAA